MYVVRNSLPQRRLSSLPDSGKFNCNRHVICPYETLVDYNVFHIHKDYLKELYISVKYDVNDIMAQHVKKSNYLTSLWKLYSV